MDDKHKLMVLSGKNPHTEKMKSPLELDRLIKSHKIKKSSYLVCEEGQTGGAVFHALRKT